MPGTEKKEKKLISYSETTAKCLKWFFANLKSELLLTKTQKTKVICEITHFSFFRETGENFSFCLVPSVGYIQTCFAIFLVTMFHFRCVNKFQQIFNVAKNLEIWRKNNKNGNLFYLLVSSLIRISVKIWNIL